MGFSPKRAKLVAQGKVLYCIMDGDKVAYSDKNFVRAIQMADQLQKANPGINYTMTIKEDTGNASK